MFIFMRRLPDQIRVSRVTGMRVAHPSCHDHAACHLCASGERQFAGHEHHDWETAQRVNLSEFLKEKC